MWFATPALAALPDLEEPLRTGASHPTDSAVVVGIEDYFVLPDVPYAQRDAELFYDFAVYTRGIPSDRVTLLTGPVSREKLVAALDAAGKQTRAGGTVFVYFAGHGAASPTTGERLLVGADAQADLDTFQARAVPVAEVRRAVTSGGGSAVLVLDTCYSGRSRSGADVVAGKRFAVPAYATATTPRVVEWTAAGPDQWSGPLDAARHGAFTYLAVGALRGWADGERDGVRDGKVTVEEASLYVESGLRTLQIRDQRPERVGDGAIVLSTGTEDRPALAPVAGVAAPAAAPVAYGAGPGQLQLATTAMVNLFVDGVVHLQNPLAGGVVRVDDLSPGAHVVELKNGFGKVVATSTVDVPPGTQIRLQYRDRTLSELGRGPVDTTPAPAPAAPAPASRPLELGRLATGIGAAVDGLTQELGAELDVTPGARDATPVATAAEVQQHLAVLDGLAMSDEKVEYLRAIGLQERFTCAQVARFVDAVPFSAQQVAAVRALRAAVADPEHVGEILAVLDFEADRRQVSALFAP